MGKNHSSAESFSNSKTKVSSVIKGNSWKGAITSNSEKVHVTVNSVSSLFNRGEKSKLAKEDA